MLKNGSFAWDLRVPVIAAPMFLVSGPDLVVEACRAGIVGTFPALNQRTSDGYAAWLDEIEGRLAVPSSEAIAPFGVNLVVHRNNERLAADLRITVEHRVPLVITSLGIDAGVIEAIQAYGGRVFHDVVTLRHAEKAAAAGVDGLIAVCAGAGGHGGLLNPFAFVSEIRSFFDGTIVLGGAISTGRQVAAARMLGADFAYMGTRFIATRESMAPDGYKAMLVASTAAAIVYTPAVSGVPGNFLRPSLLAAGVDPDRTERAEAFDFGTGEIKAWRDVWSAGQGVGQIRDIPTTAALVAALADDYQAARS
ncbi:MAG TPA: nitronate monooxygenase [Aliidongia sp.]|uniref:NAD(P)H-dependent flavin oxidoreductase n=1 Tax=Aliidongia sp. TaxID=1914230 RepID=UPI002DDDA39F|nr:nitronate monooxygenase [Aliidongia sp.]HEV2677550.1 nitronate monooxygenase [Aliidongia sp.]